MGIMDGLLNETSQKSVDKITMLEMDEIHPNPFNKAPIVNIDELVKTIQERGLDSPILVYKERNHHYVILNGERRYTACMQIGFEQIPAIIKEKPESEVDERITILDANAQRDETTEYKRQRSKEYEELYHALKEENKIPTGMLKIDWIGQHMNLSGRQVQRLLAEPSASNKTKEAERDPFLKDIQAKLEDTLDTKVLLTKNTLSFKFNSVEELKKLLCELNLYHILNE